MTFAALGLLVNPARTETSDCGYNSVAVEGSASEQVHACAALEDVLGAFASMGFRVEPDFVLTFEDQVYVELVEDALGTPGGDERLQVSAFFDARRKRIEVASFAGNDKGDRRPWGIPWGLPVAMSILHHELAHMASLSILGDEYDRVGRAWLEFIAYSVEFSIMPEELRQQILAGHPAVEPFSSPYEVNAVVLAVDPDQFGLRAHLTTQANGGLEYIRRIITDDVSFSRADILWRR